MSTPILELPPEIDLPASAAAELNMRLLWIGKQLSVVSQAATASSSSSHPTLSGPRGQRLGATMFSAQSNQGAQFYETDTTLVYVSRPIQAGGVGYVWSYLSGNMRGTYVNLPTTLNTYDTGLLYTITDKNRTLRWGGAGWTFAAWEVIPVGLILGFKADPGTGWHKCDGSTVTGGELHSDGTLHDVTFEDFTSTAAKAAYPKWNAAADGFQAAIAPLITGNTADATTGITVSAASAATAASVATTHPAATGTDFNAVTTINGGGGGGGGGAVTDPGHHHAAGALLNDALGEPRHYDLIPYQRA